MKRMLLFLIGLACCTSACLDRQEFSPEELQALVDEELEKRLVNYRKIRLERCSENLLIKANLIVDSLIFLESQPTDTSFIPKPARPEIRIVQDTRPIAPLFDTIIDSIRLDSLRLDSLNLE
ncbi:MAG: hypothetical protein Sapg2KO_47970 [Saprospiraceae bacterium]